MVKTQFGDGWIARGNIDYLSSYLFRQTFSASFNEAIYSTTNSTGFRDEEFRLLHVQHRRFAQPELRKHHAGRFDHHSQAAGIRSSKDAIIRLRRAICRSGFLSTRVSVFFIASSPRCRSQDFYETNQFTPRGNIEPSISIGIPLERLQRRAQLHDARNVLRPKLRQQHRQFTPALNRSGAGDQHRSRSPADRADLQPQDFSGRQTQACHRAASQLQIRYRRQQFPQHSPLRPDRSAGGHERSRDRHHQPDLCENGQHGEGGLHVGACIRSGFSIPLSAARLLPGSRNVSFAEPRSYGLQFSERPAELFAHCLHSARIAQTWHRRSVAGGL